MQAHGAAAAPNPGVERDYSTVGSRLVAGGMSLNTKAENLGQLNVVMKDRGDDAAEDARSPSACARATRAFPTSR